MAATPSASRIHETSTLGTLLLGATEAGLSRCSFADPDPGADPHPGAVGGPAADGEADRWLDLAAREIDALLTGSLRAFTVPVDLSAVPAFDRRVLELLLADVGVGETTTYAADVAGTQLVWGPTPDTGRGNPPPAWTSGYDRAMGIPMTDVIFLGALFLGTAGLISTARRSAARRRDEARRPPRPR